MSTIKVCTLCKRIWVPAGPRKLCSKCRRDGLEKICERCEAAFHTKTGDKFCKDCKKVVVTEMESSGYLVKPPSLQEPYRPGEKKEDVRETKFGVER